MDRSRLDISGPTGQAVYLEQGDYQKHVHIHGDERLSRSVLPETVASLASWIDRSKQVQEIEGYFRKRYTLAKRNGPVLFLLPSRSGDFGHLFIERCAREIVPQLIGDGETVDLTLAELEWKSLDEPADLLLKFAKDRDLKGCASVEDVVFRLGAAPAHHYLAIVIDGRTNDGPQGDKVLKAVPFLADGLPEITPPSRLIVFLYILCKDYHAGAARRPWKSLSLRRCRTCDVVAKLRNAYADHRHERVVLLSPLDLVGYADYERWARKLRRERPHQLYHFEVQDAWTEVFDDTDQLVPLGKIHGKLLGILDQAYNKAVRAAPHEVEA